MELSGVEIKFLRGFIGTTRLSEAEKIFQRLAQSDGVKDADRADFSDGCFEELHGLYRRLENAPV